jgi:hypothetical protein
MLRRGSKLKSFGDDGKPLPSAKERAQGQDSGKFFVPVVNGSSIPGDFGQYASSAVS